MVNFGKKLMADQIPEWKGYGLCFFPLNCGPICMLWVFWMPLSPSSISGLAFLWEKKFIFTVSKEIYLDYLVALLNKPDTGKNLLNFDIKSMICLVMLPLYFDPLWFPLHLIHYTRSKSFTPTPLVTKLDHCLLYVCLQILYKLQVDEEES